MGKIISARLATDDYDPMNLLGTTGVFLPTKHRTIKINKKNRNSNKFTCLLNDENKILNLYMEIKKLD